MVMANPVQIEILACPAASYQPSTANLSLARAAERSRGAHSLLLIRHLPGKVLDDDSSSWVKSML